MGFQGSKFEPGMVPESGTLAGAGSYVALNSDDEFILTSFFSGSGGGGEGAVTALNNKAQSRLVTIGSTTTELDGEANLTYDGSTFSIDDAAVFNDSGADKDFRVESDDETHMFFVDAGNNRVSIGDSDDAPAATLEVTNHASAGATGVALVQLNSNDLDKVALDINAANTTANAVDIAADVTTAAAVAVTANDLTTGAGLSVTSTSTDTGTGNSVLAQFKSTGDRGHDSNLHAGVYIDFDSTAGTAAKALWIDSEQTTGKVIDVDADQITTGVALEISTDARTTGTALNISDSATGDSAGSLVKIAQTGNRAGSAASIGLDIDFDTAANANARALRIDSEQTTGVVAEINGDALTTGTAIDISTDARTTGTALNISDSATNDNAGSLVKIAQTGNRAGSAASIGLEIDFDTAANAAARALKIDSEQTTGIIAEINGDALTSGTALDISADALTTGNVISIGVDDCLLSGKIIAIDHNDAATDPGASTVGILYDFDKDGTVAASVSSGHTALEINMADAATNDSNSAVTMKGLDIDVDSASNSGNNTNIGVDIKATDATNNYGIVIITDDDSATSADIVMKSDANNNDMAILAVGGEGALTIKTIDADTAAANLTLTIDGDITATAAGGDITMTTATATAAGSGVSDATSQTMYVEKKNGVIKTTILIDIAGLSSADTVGKVIGDTTDANAYLTKLTYAINGIVYEARMGCMETPNSAGTHTKNIDLRASTTNRAGAADGSGDPLWLDCGSVDWSIGAKRTPPPEDVLAALGSADDLYLYLSAGTTVSSATAAYNAGQFIIELWGAPTL